MARTNGGITGVSTKSSFGKCKQTVHTSSGVKTFQTGTRAIKALIVAGGASGGSDQGGGGGAGGLRVICEVTLSSNSAPITIGAGGTAKGSGSNSIIVGACGPVFSTGGGAQNTAGGSGGGAYTTFNAGAGNAGSFTPSEGNNGGTGGIITGCSQASGGGGGAGGAGGNSTGTAGPPGGGAKTGGAGGNGTDVSPHFVDPPNSGVFAGGGGGGAGGPGTAGGAAGPGGGSAGSINSANGNNASANTGGGAGGSGNPPAPTAGNGGSGIVITKELSKASGVFNLRSQFAARTTCSWVNDNTKFLNVDLDYLVVAGGGGGAVGSAVGGGGGAGGYRASGYGPSPLQGSALTDKLTGTYTVTVGAGGGQATQGNDSSFDTITSEGGGASFAAAVGPGSAPGGSAGGSGGGGNYNSSYPQPFPPSPESSDNPAPFSVFPGSLKGPGNNPATDPPQGNPSGSGGFNDNGPTSHYGGGGGGGATAAGGNFNVAPGGSSPTPLHGGDGGAGAPNTILGPDTSYAGGGGGGAQGAYDSKPPIRAGDGGAGGGGKASACRGGPPNPWYPRTANAPSHSGVSGASGGANTGGGGGAGGKDAGVGPIPGPGVGTGGSGGSGIVVLRAPSAVAFSGSPCCAFTGSTHPGGDKIAKFTASGTLVVTVA